jgi:hypothetical protein
MAHGRLATRAVLAQRIWGNVVWAVVIIAISLIVGMAGYMYFGPMGVAQAFANAAMILSGMGPLDKLSTPGGYYFEGAYALVSGLVFFAVAGLVLAPMLHRLLHRFHLEDTTGGSSER